MDAFGKTLAEAMSWGTPVVCFDASGPKDIVTHKHDGYKARAFESDDLALGIEWVSSAERYNELCLNARLKVMSEFDISVIAARYQSLYEDMLKERSI